MRTSRNSQITLHLGLNQCRRVQNKTKKDLVKVIQINLKIAAKAKREGAFCTAVADLHGGHRFARAVATADAGASRSLEEQARP